MYKVMLVGASGFIGRELLETLIEENYKVIAVVKNKDKLGEVILNSPNIEVLEQEKSDYLRLDSIIEKNSVDTVIYLTWEGNSGALRSDSDIQLSNVKAMLDCIKASKNIGVKRFIGIGTVSEHLILSSEKKAISENLLYAAAKVSAQQMGEILCRSNEIDFVWCRLANIYGPNNLTGNLMSYTIQALLRRERPTYSKAEVLIDFLYVKDCIAALIKVMEIQSTKPIYYIGSGQPRLLKDYLKSVRNAIDPNLELGIGERPDDGTVYLQDWFLTKDLAEDTGFSPKYSFEEGLFRTLNRQG